VAAGSIHVDKEADLDYWEVDPAWDGEIFRSAAQAQRPTGTSALPHQLKIEAGRRVCVRLVTAEGERLQGELNV
jgi:hypothetical protein